MQSSDYNDVVAGCTRGNAMLCSLGAGTGSKASRALSPPSPSALRISKNIEFKVGNN